MQVDTEARQITMGTFWPFAFAVNLLTVNFLLL